MRGIVHAMRGWPTPLGIMVNTVATSPSMRMEGLWTMGQHACLKSRPVKSCSLPNGT